MTQEKAFQKRAQGRHEKVVIPMDFEGKIFFMAVFLTEANLLVSKGLTVLSSEDLQRGAGPAAAQLLIQ